ncbi:MAG: M20 family metallopeptidase [Pyrinomonadaceae bacterium]|nr:M20 family metallopeptidase [Pyrinomonadaceae bacterium]
MTPQEVLEYFTRRESAITDAIREIVELESPSYDCELSAAVVDWIEARLRELPTDLEFEHVEADGVGTHLIIRAFPGEGPCTMLLGHTDTVHAVGTKEKNPTRIEGDRLYGCGTFDMKANIILMIEAFRYFAETRTAPQRPVNIVLSCDEEVGSRTGRAIVEREAANAECCLIPEPSAAGRVKTARKGTGMFRLIAHGIPAHAGLDPEKGANAVAELARQVDNIHALADASVGTTVNVTTFHGGTTTNVIPDRAECDIDVRFSNTGEAERVEEALRSLTTTDARVSLELLGAINRPPLERTEAVIELYQKARDIAASFGYELGETQVGGASDGNFVAALGVPVLDGLGLEGDGAHRLDEHILVSDIARRATLVTLLLGQE